MGLGLESNSATAVDDNSRLWSSLLKEVANARIGKLPQKKGLIILGDNGSGKSTLACRLSHKNIPPKSPGVEYHFVDIRDEATDDQTKLSLWILDGELEFIPFLKFPLDKKSFGDRMVAIVVDMERPWDIMSQLHRWADSLETYIQNMGLDLEDCDEFKHKMVNVFREYVEPDSLNVHTTTTGETEVSKDGSPAVTQSVKPTTAGGISLHPATAALLGLNAQKQQHVAEKINETGGEETVVKKNPVSSVLNELPITTGALVKNLGIPMLVVVTKTDIMDNLEREHGISEEQFDLIQMHIRQFCLSYGAALIYVSSKNGKNCGLLSNYLQHRIYGFPFTQNAYIIDKDSIFVPTGWDSLKKISLLEQNLTKYRPGDEFATIIPRIEKQATIVKPDPEVTAIDEQLFLSRLYTTLQRDSTSGNNTENTTTNATQESSPLDTPGTPANRPSSGSTHTSAPRSRSSVGGNTSGLSSNSSEKVLASFFNNLLSKGPSGRPTPNTSLPLANDTSAGHEGTPNLTNKEMHSELERLSRTPRRGLDEPTASPSRDDASK